MAKSLNAVPFIRSGRRLQIYTTTSFFISPGSVTNSYTIEYGDGEEEPFYPTSNWAQHTYQKPGLLTASLFELTKNPDIAIASTQKRIEIDSAFSKYDFLLSSSTDPNYTSAKLNSFTVPRGLSQWNLYVYDNIDTGKPITKEYIDADLIPDISVSNSSVSIHINSPQSDHWVVDIIADAFVPTSVSATFSLLIQNVLYKPVRTTISINSQVFPESDVAVLSENDQKNLFQNGNSIRFLSLPISPNSAIFCTNGNVYVSDNSLTTFKKLKLPSGAEGQVVQVECSALHYVLLLKNNSLLIKNYQINTPFELLELGFDSEVKDIAIYAPDADDIPRYLNTSAIYDISSQFFVSATLKNGNCMVYKYNTTLIEFEMPEHLQAISITKVVALTIINSVAVFYKTKMTVGSKETTVIRSIRVNLPGSDDIGDFATYDDYVKSLVPSEKYFNENTKFYLHSPTEALLAYNQDVGVSFDGGATFSSIGSIKSSDSDTKTIVLVTGRFSNDEIYMLDSENTFYTVFTELGYFVPMEHYGADMKATFGVDSSDSVFLISQKTFGGKCSIPIDSYISSYVAEEIVPPNTLCIRFADPPDYQLAVCDQDNKPLAGFYSNENFFTGHSIFSDEEECRFRVNSDFCTQTTGNGKIFGPLFNITLESDIDSSAPANPLYKYKIGHIPASVSFSEKDVGTTAVFPDLLQYPTIKSYTPPTDDVDTSEAIIEFSEKLRDFDADQGSKSTVLVQIIDLRSQLSPTVSFTVTKSPISSDRSMSDSSAYFKILISEPIKFSDLNLGLFLLHKTSKTAPESAYETYIITEVVSQTTIKAIKAQSSGFSPTSQLVWENLDNQAIIAAPPANFEITNQRKRPWSLQFSTCRGNLVSDGTYKRNQLLVVHQIKEGESLDYTLDLPDDGAVLTRFSNPGLIQQSNALSDFKMRYNLQLKNPNKSFTRLISSFQSGSPKCVHTAIIGLTPLCPANRRLVLRYPILEDNIDSENETILPPFYRPPSDMGRKIALSSHLYAVDPHSELFRTQNFMKSKLKMSQHTAKYDRCAAANLSLYLSDAKTDTKTNAKTSEKGSHTKSEENSVKTDAKTDPKTSEKGSHTKSENSVKKLLQSAQNVDLSKLSCHCDRVDTSVEAESATDCLSIAQLTNFYSDFAPTLIMERFEHGVWIKEDEAPRFTVSDVNNRTKFCVANVCSSEDKREVDFENGQTITFLDSELFHLKFTSLDDCPLNAYAMVYVEDEPMVRSDVFLLQSGVAIIIGLLLWILFCCFGERMLSKKSKLD